MSLMELVKRVTQKKLDAGKKPEEEQLNLPMGMGFNKVMTISPVVFALVDDSLVTPPNARENIINSISSLKNGHGDRIAYRGYVNNGENGQEQYLQVTSNADDFESIWFTTLHRHYPQTMEDMEAFMGKGYGSGEREFNISRGMLESLGFEQKVLDKVFKNMDNLVYSREIGSEDYVAPVSCVETRIDSTDQESGMEQKTNFMLYSRMLANNVKEFLWISLEAEQTRDGKTSNEVHVDFMVGLKVDNKRISII